MIKWFLAKYPSLHDSETLLWSRIKTAVGVLLLAVLSADSEISAVLSPQWLIVWKVFGAWLSMDGGFSEFTRRHRETWKGDGQ